MSLRLYASMTRKMRVVKVYLVNYVDVFTYILECIQVPYLYDYMKISALYSATSHHDVLSFAVYVHVQADAGEVPLEPFNMRREMQEGAFDADGTYIWRKTNPDQVRDPWLDSLGDAKASIVRSTIFLLLC